MTRKKAIEQLQICKDLIKQDGQDYLDERDFPLLDMAIEALSTERTGEWIDCQEYGYVECPFCGHATNCEDNKDELHFCFYCGAEMKGGEEE